MPTNSTTRFSNRVENYVKYRPGYPEGLVLWLQTHYTFPASNVIADIGSGTGISADLFLKNGYTVFGVEPNAPMRKMSEHLLKDHTNFKTINGTAEATTLLGQSIDAIVAGQAFHWFDAAKTKTEFLRILKPGGLVILIWNERLTHSPFEEAYDQLIVRHGKDYVKVDHRNINTENIEQFFQPQKCRLQIFSNRQVFDFEGLKGRLLSSSYMPAEGDEGYAAMIDDLQKLFNKFHSNGFITIHYDTKLYSGIFK
ncbi:class I SAM-dependent methyltransferase [Terrimonas sp.]|uniref:class I SAM-dependent methyltransferase n=1 Tax=Terrimonas sp. TaxID=1914338 RepID=UPI000D508542|nr:class I SAM-dependent methyltransferase [Terrimonas sp.]PVD52784.1 class I SAM-dependent methyltransferase [Terrimonas sp.]